MNVKEAIQQGIYKFEMVKMPNISNCHYEINKGVSYEIGTKKIEHRDYECGYFECGDVMSDNNLNCKRIGGGSRHKHLGTGDHENLHRAFHLLIEHFNVNKSDIEVEYRCGDFFNSSFNLNRVDVFGKIDDQCILIELGTFTTSQKFYMVDYPEVKYFIWDGKSKYNNYNIEDYYLTTPKDNYFYLLSRIGDQ